MSKSWAIAALVVGGFVGWSAGLNYGKAERQAIVDDLPETRAVMTELLADLREPNGRDLLCDEFFAAVEKETREERRLDAEEMDRVYNQLDRERD